MSDGLGAAEARSKLYDVMNADEAFEAKAEAALDIGESYLEVENGHITRVDVEGDYWKALASTDSSEGEFPPGLVLDLEKTYCRRTVDTGTTITLYDAPAQGWDDDPAFEEHGLHCYHGTNITLDEDTFGTVCFVSQDPRESPFSADETMFAELISRLLERELERQRAQRKIERLEEFADVVSHDVRNPLNVAQSRMAAERTSRDSDNLQTVASSLDRIETIIEDMLTVARQGREVTETDPVTLWSIAEQCWGSVNTGNATLTVDGEFTFRANRDRVRHLFENLYRNSVQHGGEDATVRVGALDGSKGFFVADDGPGIPPEAREQVFDSSHSTSDAGVGLGLSIVESVATAHGWTVEVTESDSGGARFEILDVVVPT